MRRSHPLYVALLAPALLAVAGLVWVAITALKSANEAGNQDLLLMGWVLTFVVGVPVLIAILPLAGALQARATKRRTVPNTGQKIP
jgi:hypothetical protein